MAYAESFIRGSQTAMLALVNARVNDICKRTDIQQTFILTALPPSNLANWSLIAPQVTPPPVVPTAFNVKNYGAAGNSRAVIDGVTSGTNTLTSATANFTTADVGKFIWAIKPGEGNTQVVISPGTVASYVSSTTITVSTAGFVTSESSLYVVLGTDDTAALIAAWTAALANPQPGLVYCPTGGYIFRQCVFNGNDGVPSPSILGDGPNQTIFFPSPDYKWSTFQNGFGMLNYFGGGSGAEIGNFTIDASDITWLTSNYGALLDGSAATYIHDIVLKNVADTGSSGASIGGICASEGIGGLWRNIQADGINSPLAAASYGSGIYINGAITRGTLFRCGGSNGTLSIRIANINNGTTLADDGAGLTLLDCLNDEGSETSLNIANSSDLTIVGCSLFGNEFCTPVTVDGTSDITIIGSVIGPYSYRNNSGALTIASGGTVRAVACRIHSSGSGTAIVNAGSFYDLGGNEITNITNTGTIFSAAQFVAVPATASSAGIPNQIAYDSTHFYVCIATNTWIRATFATW